MGWWPPGGRLPGLSLAGVDTAVQGLVGAPVPFPHGLGVLGAQPQDEVLDQGAQGAQVRRRVLVGRVAVPAGAAEQAGRGVVAEQVEAGAGVHRQPVPVWGFLFGWLV